MPTQNNLMQASCDPDCGFLIRSHDRAEIKQMVKDHAKMIHNMNTTDEELEKKIEPAVMTA